MTIYASRLALCRGVGVILILTQLTSGLKAAASYSASVDHLLTDYFSDSVSLESDWAFTVSNSHCSVIFDENHSSSQEDDKAGSLAMKILANDSRSFIILYPKRRIPLPTPPLSTVMFSMKVFIPEETDPKTIVALKVEFRRAAKKRQDDYKQRTWRVGKLKRGEWNTLSLAYAPASPADLNGRTVLQIKMQAASPTTDQIIYIDDVQATLAPAPLN